MATRRSPYRYNAEYENDGDDKNDNARGEFANVQVTPLMNRSNRRAGPEKDTRRQERKNKSPEQQQGWVASMSLYSPPPALSESTNHSTRRHKKSPFHVASINRTTKTPTYRVAHPPVLEEQEETGGTNEGAGVEGEEESTSGAPIIAYPWQPEVTRVESLVSAASSSIEGSQRSLDPNSPRLQTQKENNKDGVEDSLLDDASSGSLWSGMDSLSFSTTNHDSGGIFGNDTSDRSVPVVEKVLTTEEEEEEEEGGVEEVEPREHPEHEEDHLADKENYVGDSDRTGMWNTDYGGSPSVMGKGYTSGMHIASNSTNSNDNDKDEVDTNPSNQQQPNHDDNDDEDDYDDFFDDQLGPIPRFRSEKTGILFGEAIDLDESESSRASSQRKPPRFSTSSSHGGVSFDIESNVSTEAGKSTIAGPSAVFRNKRTSFQTIQSRASTMLEKLGSSANSKISKIREVATDELRQAIRNTKERVFRDHSGQAHNLRDGAESLDLEHGEDDLEVLQSEHKHKIDELLPIDTNEPFDFAIVLVPQPTYSFWADRLDFRTEYMIDLSADDANDQSVKATSTDETSETDGSPEKVVDVIDARPFGFVPESGIRQRSSAKKSRKNQEKDQQQDQQPPSNGNGNTSWMSSSSSARKGHGTISARTPSMRPSLTPQPNRTPKTTGSDTPSSTRGLQLNGFLSAEQTESTSKQRLSLFERAVGGFSPNSRMSFMTASRREIHDIHGTPTSQMQISRATPMRGYSTGRRRWGNRTVTNHDDSNSPNFESISRRSLMTGSAQPKRRVPRFSEGSRTSPAGTITRIEERNNTNSATNISSSTIGGRSRTDRMSDMTRGNDDDDDSLIDLPNQAIPRGIVARMNGMNQFLTALKRGIVVRRHRAGMSAAFVKIFSTDGGDTIRFEPIEQEDAILALKEQRQRYNRNLDVESEEKFARTISQKWNHNPDGTTGENGTGNGNNYDASAKYATLPDFIAARQYRQQQVEKEKKKSLLQKTVVDAAKNLANTGTIRTSDVVAVHPANHEDPRSGTGALGTHSLRRSKSEYHTPNSFSIVQKGSRHLNSSKLTTVAASQRWYAGEGNDVQFKTIDFETATDGEYWMIFRGFLLLHRDAVSGRFAAQRTAGFGSNYARRDNEDQDSDAYNRLQTDIYHEPKTISRLERFVARMREVDISDLLTGWEEPNAVPPPPDYFLGFRSPGTQIWSRLRQAGLDTTRIYGLDTKRVMIKVRCPSERLTDVAEVLRIKLKTREGDFAPFREDAIDQYDIIQDDTDHTGTAFDGASLFRSCQRQTVIDFIIRSRLRDTGAELTQTNHLGKMILAQVPLHNEAKLTAIYNAWFHYWHRENWILRDGRSMSIDQADAKRVKEPTGYQPLSPGRAESQIGSVQDDDQRDPSRRSRGVPNVLSRIFLGCFYQPLDSVEQYFGEKVAMYFAWLQHCSYYLIFLSVAGLIVFFCQLTSGNWDHPIKPFFALVVMIWSFVVLVNWKKRSNLLAYRWGSMDHKVQETTRPQFQGEPMKDPITGEWVVYYPTWKRWLKHFISLPITVAFTFCTLIVILSVHANRDRMIANYFANEAKFAPSFSIEAIGSPAPMNIEITQQHLRDPNFWLLMAGMPALLGLCLPLLNFILMRISIMLNDFENYRTESEYRTHLIIKVFSFRFVCYFATLYYYCVMSVVADEKGYEGAMESGNVRVATGVFVYVTVAHWWGVFLQIQFPILIHKCRQYLHRQRLWRELVNLEIAERNLDEEEAAAAETEAEATGNKRSPHHRADGAGAGVDNDAETVQASIAVRRVELVNKRLLLDQAQDKIWKQVTLPAHDSFPEYIQAVVQFAFVTCFSVVLPITPLICLVNHLLSMRFDAYKLCRGRRRPLPQQTGGIGIWEHVLHIVTVIAVLTNCALMGFTNSQFAWIGDRQGIGKPGLFAIVVAWEHIMLLIKYAIQSSTPKLPKAISDAMKKQQHNMTRMRNKSMQVRKERRSQTSISKLSIDLNPSFEDIQRNNPTQMPPGPSSGIFLREESAIHPLATIPSEEASEMSPLSKAGTAVSSSSSSASPSKKKASSGEGRKTSTTSESLPTGGGKSVRIVDDNTGQRTHPSNGAKARKDKDLHDTLPTGRNLSAESPFKKYFPKDAVPAIGSPDAISLGKHLGDVLGGGIEDDNSLATNEQKSANTTPHALTREQESFRANAEASQRITDRLNVLQKKLKERKRDNGRYEA